MYHASHYRTDQHVDSYWAATAGAGFSGAGRFRGSQHCDVAVVGGGYTGLSAALFLAGEHQIDVRVLEAGPIGWGASGRNGGFCCLGGTALDYRTMARKHGLTATRDYLAMQISAVDLVRSLIDDHAIDADPVGHGELEVAHRPNRLAELTAEAELLRDHLGLACRIIEQAAFREHGYDGPEVFGALHVPIGFGLHPLNYAHGLAGAAIAAGARLHAHSRVTDWQRDGTRHRLITTEGTLTADQVILATNGYTEESLHPALGGRILPVLSNIMVTRPLTAQERAAHRFNDRTPMSDSRAMLHYFRLLPDDRLLFGGRGGISAEPSRAAAMEKALRAAFERMFPQWRSVETEYSWRGLAAVARDMLPHISSAEDDPTVHYGLAFHGNGVAMATWSGKALAARAAGATRGAIPDLAARPLRRFPWPALRLWYLRGAYGRRAFSDRFL